MIGGNANKEIIEGSDLSFECNVQSNPPINEVAWQMNDIILMPNSRDDILIENQSLFISNISRYHSGKFRCLAANVEGESISRDFILTVKCKLISSNYHHQVNTFLFHRISPHFHYH